MHFKYTLKDASPDSIFFLETSSILGQMPQEVTKKKNSSYTNFNLKKWVRMYLVCIELQEKLSAHVRPVMQNLNENLALKEIVIDSNLPWELIHMATLPDIHLK